MQEKAWFGEFAKFPSCFLSLLHYMLSNKKIKNRLLLALPLQRFGVSETHLAWFVMITGNCAILLLIHPFWY